MTVVSLSGCGAGDTIKWETAAENAEDPMEDSLAAAKEGDPGGSSDTEKTICVYICGAVIRPGLYEFTEGDRIGDALETAGGFAPDADETAVNLALYLEDGMQIIIPVVGDDVNEADDGLVNLNTASQAELMNLPGIGQAKAEAIVAYRTQHGPFGSVEDLMQVEGIKEGVFAKIASLVCV